MKTVEFKLTKMPKGSGGIQYEGYDIPTGSKWIVYVPQRIAREISGDELIPSIIELTIGVKGEVYRTATK